MDLEVHSGATELPEGLSGELFVERLPDWETEIMDFGPEGPTHLPTERGGLVDDTKNGCDGDKGCLPFDGKFRKFWMEGKW